MSEERTEQLSMPVLPLRDVVVYPHMVIPLFVGREKSIRCLEAAMDADKKVFLAAQKDASVDEPTEDDIYRVGTVATLLQLLKLPDGTVKVLVEGQQRAQLDELQDDDDYFKASIHYLASDELPEKEQEVMLRSAMNQFEGYVKLNKKIPPEVLTSLSGIDDCDRLADTMAAHMPVKLADKQHVLEITDVRERIEYLMALMEGEIDILQSKNAFAAGLKSRWKKPGEYYLNEQMKAIQKNLVRAKMASMSSSNYRKRLMMHRCRRKPAKKSKPSCLNLR